MKERGQGPLKKGDLCKMVADEVSVPAAGTKGLKVADLSPAALPYLQDVEGLMLRAPDEADWVKYEATSSFTDAGWKKAPNRNKLGLKMWQAGMLVYTKEVKEKVGIFTVVKTMAEGSTTGVAKSRLAWDCRRLNLRFRRPPWTDLGSPSAMAAVDRMNIGICSLATVQAGGLSVR